MKKNKIFVACDTTNTKKIQEIIKLLLCDGKLIKRPFLVLKEKKIILGFNEAGYSNQFIQDGYLSPS